VGRLSGARRRLERLEEQRGIHFSSRESIESEERRKRAWLATAGVRRNHDLNDGKAWHVRDVIKVLRTQGRLPATTEELRHRLLAWRPPMDRTAIERELAKFIYNREEGTEAMVCPPAWRESFVAADELRRKFAAVPDEVSARWLVWLHELEQGEGDDHVIEKMDTEAEEYGITNELMWKALGPDAEEIPDEERERRLMKILANFYYGEQGYRIQQEIYRLLEKRGV
jgi:hypothetical protein